MINLIYNLFLLLRGYLNRIGLSGLSFKQRNSDSL